MTCFKMLQNKMCACQTSFAVSQVLQNFERSIPVEVKWCYGFVRSTYLRMPVIFVPILAAMGFKFALFLSSAALRMLVSLKAKYSA